MKKAVILMTGTVNPRGMTLTKLMNPSERLTQYLFALKYWLTKTDLQIVFVENSNTDISILIDNEFKNRVEFLTFMGNDQPKHLGKGYGEMNCLKFASENSLFLKESSFVFKITGRYIILNFNTFYDYWLKNPRMYIYADFQQTLKAADARLFCFDPDFLQTYLLKWHQKINEADDVIFEHVLAKAILESIVENNKFVLFSSYPKIIGISGTSNRPYKSGFFFFFRKQIEQFVKAFLMER